jgi:haloalkane dehalogenase
MAPEIRSSFCTETRNNLYIWRNIIPVAASRGLCIAPDLIGFGKSDKPALEYTYFEHARYVDGFIKALDLKNITLVIHDWGGAFGFDYALRNRDNIKAIAFHESVNFTFTWDSFPAIFREYFRRFRTSDEGWELIGEKNTFIEKILPGGIIRKLSREEHDWYRAPFPTAASRKPIWMMPNMVPFDDRRDDTWYAVKKIEERLPSLTMPTLLLWAEPGAIVHDEERVKWHQERLPALEVVKLANGVHFLQEDHPEAIGEAIVDLIDRT